MAKHTCYKEVDLAEMKTDLKYLVKISEERQKSDIEYKKSMELRVDSLEQYKNKASGAIAVIASIGAFLGGLAMWILNKVWK